MNKNVTNKEKNKNAEVAKTREKKTVAVQKATPHTSSKLKHKIELSE